MKSNINPLYLIKEGIFGTALDNSSFIPDGVGAGSNQVIRAGIGAGSKYFKDKRTADRIIAEFPDPMKLREWLYSLPSNEAKQIAQRISPNMSNKQYRFLIQRYILKGSFGRYLLHAYGGTYSGIGNAFNAASNEFNDVKTIMRDNVG